jgi:hypothetical protein
MCRIDGRVTKEVSKREVRDAHGFWGGCLSVDINSPAVKVTVGAAVVTSAVSKVLWWSLSISQVGWVR